MRSRSKFLATSGAGGNGFLNMMAGNVKLKDLLLGDELETSGSKVDLVRFFSLFDKAKGVFPFVTP